MTKKIKLICLPFAGGGANIYEQWRTKLSDHIQICPVDLAGRGNRITEKPYKDLEEAVNDAYRSIENDIAEGEYAIFGHSMGALLAYELIQKIRTLGKREPLHVFFSGRKPVHIPKTENFYRDMNAAEFKKAVLSLGVTPREIFENKELNEIFIPILRSDFCIAETFVERPEILPLDIEISALIGKEEAITTEEAVQWKLHTSEKCSIYFMEGGHFFLLDDPQAVIDIINSHLSVENCFLSQKEYQS